MIRLGFAWRLIGIIAVISSTAIADTLSRSQGSLVVVGEAEKMEIKCAAGSQPGDNLWASGEFFTPRFFGKAVGDSLTWRFELASPLDSPILLARYAYDEPGYTGYAGYKPPREFQIFIDSQPPLKLNFLHSGGWDEYVTVSLKLPPSLRARTQSDWSALQNTQRPTSTRWDWQMDCQTPCRFPFARP